MHFDSNWTCKELKSFFVTHIYLVRNWKQITKSGFDSKFAYVIYSQVSILEDLAHFLSLKIFTIEQSITILIGYKNMIHKRMEPKNIYVWFSFGHF